jgi:hypothetical protein
MMLNSDMTLEELQAFSKDVLETQQTWKVDVDVAVGGDFVATHLNVVGVKTAEEAVSHAQAIVKLKRWKTRGEYVASLHPAFRPDEVPK